MFFLNDFTSFGRRRGSKDKKKRNISKSGLILGGVPAAYLAGVGLTNAYMSPLTGMKRSASLLAVPAALAAGAGGYLLGSKVIDKKFKNKK